MNKNQEEKTKTKNKKTDCLTARKSASDGLERNTSSELLLRVFISLVTEDGLHVFIKN